MTTVLEREVAPKQVSGFVREAITRMQESRPLFAEAERKALAAYDGPIVSGDPEGKLPDNLEEDDNE